MIIENLRKKATEALKAGDKDTAALYRLIIGQSQQTENGGADDNVCGIIKKVIKGNNETIEAVKELPEKAEYSNKLLLENQLLSEFLPTAMSAEDIQKFISDNSIDVLTPKNEGQAVGLVMKAIKSSNLSVDGALVKEVIIKLRC